MTCVKQACHCISLKVDNSDLKELLIDVNRLRRDYYERVHVQCQNERMAQHRMYTWGNRQKARDMEMPACAEMAELNQKLGIRQNMYGF